MFENVKAIVFDLDGTLLDTLQDLTNAVNYALKQNGLAERTIEEVRSFVGNGVELLMIRAVPGGRENPVFPAAFADFKEYYAVHCKDNTKPYPDVWKLMTQLQERGICMAIVSNKIDFAVKELNEEFFAQYTSAAIGEMEGVKRKPSPDTVNKALEQIGIPREYAVYVGDSDVDIETAANAGIPCISVTWGFRSREFLQAHHAQHIIDTPMELLDIL